MALMVQPAVVISNQTRHPGFTLNHFGSTKPSHEIGTRLQTKPGSCTRPPEAGRGLMGKTLGMGPGLG